MSFCDKILSFLAFFLFFLVRAKTFKKLFLKKRLTFGKFERILCGLSS